MVFWAHPEAANIDKSGHVAIETPEHTGLLLKTTGYTGFCIFYEGFKKVGNVSGLWDMLLTEYCRGYRAMPVWAIAGLAYDRTGELTSALRDERTVILSKSATVDSALKRLNTGVRIACMAVVAHLLNSRNLALLAHQRSCNHGPGSAGKRPCNYKD